MQLTNRTVLVTGASRGIGLQLVADLLARGNTVIAAARSPGSSTQLAQLASGSSGGNGSGTAQVVQLDISSAASIDACAKELQQRFKHIDVVINNAGIGEFRTFEEETEDNLLATYQTNTVGPFLLTQALRRAGLIGGPAGESLVVNISSILGSLAFDGFNAFPAYAYRVSKAALNMLTKHIDLALAPHGVTCVAIHPGYVKTDINKGAGDIEVEDSARGILAVLESGKDLHGAFFAWDGSELPW